MKNEERGTGNEEWNSVPRSRSLFFILHSPDPLSWAIVAVCRTTAMKGKPMSAVLREQARSIWDAAVAAADPVAPGPRRPDCDPTCAGRWMRAGPHPRGRRRQGRGGDGGRRRGGAGRSARSPLRRGQRAGRGGSFAAGCPPARRPAGRHQPSHRGRRRRRSGDAGSGTDGGAGRPRPVPAVRRRLGPAAGAGRGRQSLEDKQHVTALLHACGATIDEMNCVRKHLSRFKGGRLAQAFAEHDVRCTALSFPT